MYIKCEKCSHCEEVNSKLFLRILGGAVAGSGYWAWVAYIFAGTGFAMPICIAIMAGGVAMVAYTDEIIAWISKRHNCEKCGSNKWVAVEDQVAKDILADKEKIKNLSFVNQKLEKDIAKKDEVIKATARSSFKINKEKLKKLVEENDLHIEDFLEELQGLELLLASYKENPEVNQLKIENLSKKMQSKMLELDSLIANREKYASLQNAIIDDEINPDIFDSDMRELLGELKDEEQKFVNYCLVVRNNVGDVRFVRIHDNKSWSLEMAKKYNMLRLKSEVYALTNTPDYLECFLTTRMNDERLRS